MIRQAWSLSKSVSHLQVSGVLGDLETAELGTPPGTYQTCIGRETRCQWICCSCTHQYRDYVRA
jgi:hypothetical protein